MPPEKPISSEVGGVTEGKLAAIGALCRDVEASVTHGATPIVAVERILAIIGTGGDEGMRGMTEVQTSGQVAYEALARAAGSDPTWPAGATMRAWDRLPPNQQAAWEAAAQAVAVAERERIRQLAIQHDAFYDAPCPDGASDCIHQDTPFADLITEPSGG